MNTKAEIIARLQREILPLQGFKSTLKNTALDKSLGPIKMAFPNNSFPLGAVHEFISKSAEDNAVTNGFLSALLNSIMKKKGTCIWIGNSKTIFPPAFKSFGISPDKLLFIDLHKAKEILWTMEEALKCKGLSAVIAELPELNFTASRRLQLAVEQSKVTGFVIRQNPLQLNTTACLTRWKISSLSSESVDGLPGVGFPRWNVELLKVRNGNPSSWQIEFVAGQFRFLHKTISIPLQKKKTG